MINKLIEDRADKLLKNSNCNTLPIDLEKCLNTLKVQLDNILLEDNISGFLAINNGVVKLGVNTSHPPKRQRFTIAHEIGHFILHAVDTPFFLDKTNLQFNRNEDSTTGEFIKEREANNFAAALLMPQNLIEIEINKMANKSNADKLIKDLAKKFDVSIQAMGIRLSHLGYLDYNSAYL